MQCFVLQYSNLKGIFSPLFFISTPDAKGEFVELQTLAEINPRRKINVADLEQLVPYVGLPETDNLEVQTILYRPYKEVKGRNIIHPGDILFARIEPSVFNKKYIFVDHLDNADYALTSTEFYVLQAKQGIYPKFLFHILFSDFVFKQVAGKTTGSTGRRRLDKGAFEKLLIPKVSKAGQEKIAVLMDTAYANRKQKEMEADRLLASIDNYVLSELGTTLPKAQPKIYFAVLASDIKGRRIDPLYYSQSILASVLALPHKTIGEVTERIKTGFAAGKQDQETDDPNNGIIQIRPTNLDDQGNLKFDRNIYISKSQKSKRTSDLLEKNEVLFNNTNSQELVGKTVYFDLAGDYFCSNHITRIKVKNPVLDPVFLSIILNIYQKIRVFYSICTNWNNQSGVNAELLGSLPIPCPSFKMQQRIAAEVQSRMERAQALRREAARELEKAKQQVEAMILGKAS